MESPELIQFVSMDSNGDIAVTPEAMSFLGSLPTDQKLAIVTCVGTVSSGKTQFACRLAGAKSDNLEGLKTSGIMMWAEPVPVQKNMTMLVLDMQGIEPAQPTQLSSIKSARGIQQPKPLATDKLMQFAALISSMLVYTQRGTLDKLVDNLDPVVRFSKQLAKELEAEAGNTSMQSDDRGNLSARSVGTSLLDMTQAIGQETQEMFCSQLFCLIKDFKQSEEDGKAGLSRKASARKQLDASLKPLPGVSSEAIRKNKTVEGLKILFSHNDAFACPNPEENANDFSSETAKVC